MRLFAASSALWSTPSRFSWAMYFFAVVFSASYSLRSKITLVADKGTGLASISSTFWMATCCFW